MYAGTDEQLDALASGRLIPNDKATKKGNRTSWFELAQVRDITFKSGAELKPNPNMAEREGDTIGQLEVALTIDPASPMTKVPGSKTWARLRFNVTAFNEGREGMANRKCREAYGGMVGLIKAFNLPSELAKDPVGFAAKKNEILGRRLTIMVAHDHTEDGRIFENITLFAPEEMVYEV